ncbi:3294_t:CDS:2 [Funneliformis geosporum]|uniref:1570_t:CDS:1 n=1 Tax=Funneliformis geosporum TaxID=1117311 RepID=A0A9W4SGD5_9GLOM|nr:3294_t:CDS:2 [Funneliformis geosporum]CAI2168648.1 1570_t:CDS:2 [Funneliformis geosporum]
MSFNLVCLGAYIAKYLYLRQLEFKIPLNKIEYVYLALLIGTLLKDVTFTCAMFRGSMNVLNPRKQIISHVLLLIAWMVISGLYTKFELNQSEKLPLMCPSDFDYEQPEYMTACKLRRLSIIMMWSYAGTFGLSVILNMLICFQNAEDYEERYEESNSSSSRLSIMHEEKLQFTSKYSKDHYNAPIPSSYSYNHHYSRRSPASFLTCSSYESRQRQGCITYLITLTFGFFISALYILSSILTTWLWTRSSSATNTNSNPNRPNLDNAIDESSKSSSLILSKFNQIRNSQIIDDILEFQDEQRNSEILAEMSLKEFIELNKRFSHLFNDGSEFNGTDGTIVIFRKPSPSYLRYESSSRNSSYNSLCESNLEANRRKYMSEYSLDSSFSRTYGSIIIPRKYLPNAAHSETDSTNSVISRCEGTIIMGRNQITSTYSENSSKRLSSAFSDQTSSSKYDGSIIIKLVE